MEKRTLGKSGIAAAPLAFGGNVFGWTIDEPASHRLLDAFVAEGLNLIDTSDSYCRWHTGEGGESETIIGNWLKKSNHRDKVVIATKVGSDMGQGRPDLSKKWILEEVEASLRRLQTDYIDLYQSHFDDLTTPVGETLESFAQLVQQGKVRAIGASNLSPDRLRDSLEYSRQKALPRYQTLQPEYNLYNRQKFEQDYAPICSEEGLGVLPYFALAGGFLTGKYRRAEDAGKSKRGGGIVQKYLNDRGYRILAALDAVAQQYNTTQASVALAWLIAQPMITAPIASATTMEQLQDLVKGARLQLSEEAVQQLTEASAY